MGQMPAREFDKARRAPAPGVLVVRSVVEFAKLLRTRSLYRSRDHLGIAYRIDEGGTYQAFRDTIGRDDAGKRNVVLVVGFRLRVLRNVRVLHRMFQRICLLTTPFWSGFHGFRQKLWMVDPETKNYLGIYEWSGQENAELYATTLIKVLKPISTKGSVWYHIYPDRDLAAFLRVRRVEPLRVAPRPVFPRG